MRKLLSAIVVMMICAAAHAQILTPVKWSYAAKKVSANEYVIFMRATIDNGWHVYSQNVKDGGPVKTTFTFPKSKDYTLVGKTVEPTPVTKFENAFKMNVSYFEKEVVFQQRIKLNSAKAVVKGQLEYMTCNDKQCLPPEDVDFSVAVAK
ncbi:protein-disulfide reductase DsbD domain-containing protein [Mucilaginibacter sp. KACC 22063]|uniref:protein-disulfide reductase DsbD domain-containing protein n=1 Tax=Mucilaginibacter sp. KACC 22063 TaxID=3025666 RepID=UPI0023666ECE|nr:protein-disulfide reductase DsbD domain-containing protein [Mucilaginibacter sp. KACC 22063]WDF55284.1 protein-disulfide reductase DsbD family protein [Mucilaginibacter sp. KACC 22063]